jgi:ATP-dependent DNA ligase
MVAKRRHSLYAGTHINDWLKARCLRAHDFVMGRWIPDGRQPFRELLLGEYINGELR